MTENSYLHAQLLGWLCWLSGNGIGGAGYVTCAQNANVPPHTFVCSGTRSRPRLEASAQSLDLCDNFQNFADSATVVY